MKPYKEQIDAVRIATALHQGCIVMPTGSGKSITMALLINSLQVRTLVVVPNLALKDQMRKVFLSLFGTSDNIVVENIDSPALLKEDKFDCLLVDEAHHSAAKTFRKLNAKFWNNIYYRYFFTATPFRSRPEEQILMESICGDVIYELTHERAVTSGYVVPIEAYYYTLPKIQMKGNDRDWRSVYSELVVNNVNRNNKIAEVLDALAGATKSTLCLVKEIAHGEILSRLTGIPFANGKDGKSQELIRQFSANEIGQLIGTTGVVGEGVDTKPAEYVLLAGSGKSKTQFMQNVGRAMRRYGDKQSGKLIMFKDPSHKYLTRHFNQCMLYLRDEYGIKAVKL